MSWRHFQMMFTCVNHWQHLKYLVVISNHNGTRKFESIEQHFKLPNEEMWLWPNYCNHLSSKYLTRFKENRQLYINCSTINVLFSNWVRKYTVNARIYLATWVEIFRAHPIEYFLVHPAGSSINSAFCEDFSKFCLHVFQSPKCKVYGNFIFQHVQN